MVNIVTEVLSTVTLSPYLIRFVGVNWPLLGSLKAWLKEYGHGFKKKKYIVYNNSVLCDSIVSYLCMSITLCNQFCKKQLHSPFLSSLSFHLRFQGPDFHSRCPQSHPHFKPRHVCFLLRGATSSLDSALTTRRLLSLRMIQRRL